MSNSAALKNGAIQARKLIDNHILNEIMIPIATNVLALAMTHRDITIKHNMTGNTINAYVVAIFKDGNLIWDSKSADHIAPPVRRKLTDGEVYPAGSPRWDGYNQDGNFKASVETNQQTEISSSTMSFVQSYKTQSTKGWELLVCNGVEYASFQESSMGIDVLNYSFINVQSWHKSYFKPIS